MNIAVVEDNEGNLVVRMERVASTEEELRSLCSQRGEIFVGFYRIGAHTVKGSDDIKNLAAFCRKSSKRLTALEHIMLQLFEAGMRCKRVVKG